MPNSHNLCRCGKQKDCRANQCAVCSKRSYPVNESYELARVSVEDAVASACTYSGAAKKLGCSRKTITRLITKYGFDTSHMRRTRGRLPTDEDIFKADCKRRNGTVRNYVVKHNIIPYVCYACGQKPEWDGKPLTLQLEHKDGNATNNQRGNLRFMCPNCHSQTETYCGRNGRGKKKPRRQ